MLSKHLTGKRLALTLAAGLLFFAFNGAQAQNKTIRGVVVDASNEPLIGASVQEKGTSNGVITDLDGNYTLTVDPESMLVISYIGCETLEIKASDVPATIRLKNDLESLQETVVIGYGTQKKVNLTGAVSAASGDDMKKRPVANTATMLQGLMPGLRITSDRGQPGDENVQIRVRGQGTYSNAGSNPLVLINGVEGDIATLDPNIIESVSVLKDAASASIYGSRAANGVILVTTKDGSENPDKFNITYNGNFASHTPTTMLDLIWDSPTYMKYYNIARINSGAAASAYTDEQIAAYTNATDKTAYPSFNWLDWFINPAFVQTHNVNISGSSGKTSYNASATALDQPGTEQGQAYKRYNVALDLTSRLNDWMRFGMYFSASRSNRQQTRQGDTDALLSAISQAPTYMPWFFVDGTEYYTYKAYPNEGGNKNMYAIVKEQTFKTSINTDVNAQGWLEISPVKGLTWYNKGAVRYRQKQEKDWRYASGSSVYYYHSHDWAQQLNTGGDGLDDEMDYSTYLNFYSTLKYDLASASKNHEASLMAGYSVESYRYDYLHAYRQDFDFPLHEIDAGTTKTVDTGGNAEEWGLVSAFFRANCSYKQRYLLEANVRYDGSSRIAKANRWGWFPSVSAGWRVTEEDFIKDSAASSWLNNFKIRASYGLLGNQSIDLYSYYSTVSTGLDYSFDNDQLTSGIAQTSISNENLKWETTALADAGFDLTLFRGLNVTFDWYHKRTYGILRQAQGNALLALDAPYINGGEMVNRGVELSVSYADRVKNGFFEGLEYNAGFYVEHTKNILTKYGSDEISSGLIYREGEPYGSFYMLEAIGIFADQAEIDASPKQYNDKTEPGDIKYLDWDNDNDIDDDDRHIVGNRFPQLEYSINLSANWKGFDLSLMGQGVQGVNHYADHWGVRAFRQGTPISQENINGMWTEENPYNAKYPKLYYDNMGGTKNNRTSTYYLFDGSYFRLKNLTFGYTLPANLTRRFWVDRLRFYFSGDNLVTFTKFPQGGDPERNYTSKNNTRLVYYPQNKIYSLGVNLTF